jgi:hypothetical protein
MLVEEATEGGGVECHVGRRSCRGGGLKVMLVEEATEVEG